MLRTVAHETRNHLNAINQIVCLFIKDPSLSHKIGDLKMLKLNIQNIIVLTNDLLDFATVLSGREHVKWEPTRLDEIFDDVVATLQPMALHKDLKFNAVLEEKVTVFTDPHKIHRIALNLGSNAIKYTREGMVSLRFAPCDGSCWMIEVRDTGPGIQPEDRERIFEEFQRILSISGNEPGVGLGLAIVRQLVSLLGGRIELESEVGVGTCFRVILPNNPPPATNGEAVPTKTV
ncbi:MAG: hypothetical protein QOD99_3114, partial [Chthoniobacter sp.]|nr:hypothetical protein [Chthoniobacter sp.]